MLDKNYCTDETIASRCLFLNVPNLENDFIYLPFVPELSRIVIRIFARHELLCTMIISLVLGANTDLETKI